MVDFEEATLIKGAYVLINGVEYPVHQAQYSGGTPLSPENMNKIQEDLQEEINGYTKTVDENGWTVLNFGKYKEYVKKVSKTITYSGNEWAKTTLTNLPHGMSTLGTNILTSSSISTDSAISCNIGAHSDSTEIKIDIKNQYGGSVTATIYVGLRILEA